MLQFEGSWRFKSPGSVPPGVVNAFYSFIDRIAVQGDEWRNIERFKSKFGGGSSSNLSWARSDLHETMNRAAQNAPLFIDTFYTACVEAQNAGLDVPSLDLINGVLAEHDAGYQIQPPNLISTKSYAPVDVPRSKSLADEVHPLIEKSLATSESFLRDGQGRQAVQEVLWLLETVVTAFRQTGAEATDIQGKYFVPIVREMKARGRNKPQEQILHWMTTLHGFLSSPTGGGVRHGVDIAEVVVIQPHEARLYCNLTRSYITFMMEEHERQAKGMPVS